ncbi:hypothetical protein H6F93_11385 [Leptolyngbya sp. FACHB-671]|uniref:hypothetical protein n=1 Tax=Leptolyngbya sp. FACHB-671 TaxID=2692812 RepID=UPI001681E7DB|nr:hypothetical protein [Leptolyngbya sp. FACHB-671]MBD2068119.1 hypothetical protein [Leptolyngbya sp. FACHB-671]
MPQAQTIETSSDSTLSKLLEADAALVAEVAALTAQLEAIGQKRQGLQTVIELFSSTDSSSVESPSALEEQSKPASPAPPAADPLIAASDAETAGSKEQVAKGTKTPAKGRNAKTTRKLKSDEPAKGWQHYIRKEFAKLSLPRAVASVMQSQPEAVLGVPEIVNTLFVDATPQAARNDARNRVSNVLSIGLKNDQWYWAKKGQYSLSREVAEASVAS